MANRKIPELKVPENEDRELELAANHLEEMVAELGEQELDQRDKNLLETIYSRLDIFKDLNGDYHDKAKEARKVLHMDDPGQDDAETLEENGKPTLQLQTLKSTINNVVADQMLAMPEVKLLPETAAMQESADELQDMVHYVMYCANNFEQINHKLCEDFYGPGTSICQIAWDPDMNYGKGEIALIRWPIESFLWDPKADNIQDCRAVMKLSWHPLSWYRFHYPETGIYVGDEWDRDDIGKTEGQENVDHQADEQSAMLIEYWWREYDAKSRRYKISVAYAAGNALLDVDRDIYAHGMYPFVIDVHDQIEGSIAGDGLVRQLTPMMRYINRYAAYIDMNARMSSKGRILTREGSGIDKDALANWKEDIIEGKRIIRGEDWDWLQSAPFNGVINQAMLQMQTDLKQDSGANQFTRGETTGGIVSGKAINSLIQAGGKVSSMRTEQRKYGVKQIAEQILWLMAQYYDDDRVVMITGKKLEIHVDTEKLFGKKTKGAVNPPPYTVQIEISSKDPQRIANQNQMFMEAYTMSAQAQQFFPLSALFEILNLDGKDRILPVIRNNETYQQQMQQLQQQVEQMSQQMQQMQTENQNLRRGINETANALATQSARRGGPAPEESAIVNQAENNFGQQTGQALPV